MQKAELKLIPIGKQLCSRAMNGESHSFELIIERRWGKYGGRMNVESCVNLNSLEPMHMEGACVSVLELSSLYLYVFPFIRSAARLLRLRQTLSNASFEGKIKKVERC